MTVTNSPIQKLLFFVAQDFEDSLVEIIERFVQDLSRSRDWSVAAPVFVNESADEVITLGGYLSIYSALPPHDLPTELDRRNLDEVKDLISGLRKLSQEQDIDFELELDGVPVGAVEGGQPDRSLRTGLIEEWERVLSEREAQAARAPTADIGKPEDFPGERLDSSFRKHGSDEEDDELDMDAFDSAAAASIAMFDGLEELEETCLRRLSGDFAVSGIGILPGDEDEYAVVVTFRKEADLKASEDDGSREQIIRLIHAEMESAGLGGPAEMDMTFEFESEED